MYAIRSYYVHPVAQQIVIGLEVDRCHHGDEITYLIGMQRAVAKAEGAALTNAENVDLVQLVALTDDIDAAVHVTVDVIVKRQVAISAIGITPVD